MGTMLDKLRALWRGQLPLEVAFWHFAIYYGLIVNVLATTVSIVLLLADAPIGLALIVHVVPLPYSVVTVFGALSGLVRAVDRKDRYTKDHSDLVSEYATRHGRFLRLSPEELDALDVARDVEAHVAHALLARVQAHSHDARRR